MPSRASLLGFADLPGWAGDDHAAALTAFRSTCDLLPGPDWAAIAAEADRVAPGAARQFFESRFRPVRIEDGTPALLTGYYEPEIDGARSPDATFRVPLHALPPEAPRSRPWLSRAEIEDGALAGRGLELAWVADPVEAFFLQVQGSGRIRLRDGGVLRLGYAGGNGQPYASVGRMLVARGAVPPERVSAEAVKAWLRAHPAEGAAVMRANASYVFFRVLAGLLPGQGPLGTMGRPVTAGRTVAVDPAHVPLGAPVWIATDAPEPLRRLMVAQDTGGAIRGAQRADVYFGTGPEAGRRAGRLKAGGMLAALLPVARAEALARGPDGPAGRAP